MAGLIALIGGGAWREGCAFDRGLLEASGGNEVLVLPTAAAYENPDSKVAMAGSWFSTMGATVAGVAVLQHHDAMDPDHADVVRRARFIYLSGGSPLHLRSVLKDSAVWAALVTAWEGGAVVAGVAEAAMALCDPMIDPRGGACTVGLGLILNMAVAPHAGPELGRNRHRTLELAGADLPVAAIPDETALLRDPDGSWRVSGRGEVTIYLNGQPAGLDALPR